MRYRKLGKLDWDISEISVGVLRQEEAAVTEKTDRTERIGAIRYAIDSGVNYINLGFPFYFGDHQKACEYIRESLSAGYREKVKAAINIPSGKVSSLPQLDNMIDEQLRLFDLDKADFCVIDGVNRAVWDKLKSTDITGLFSKIIASGRVDHFALGFHDDPHFLKGIIDTYPMWAFIQIELSILDYTHHPGVGCFTFAGEHDIAVISTDITKAGRLLKNIPEHVREVLDGSQSRMAREERYIRWVLGFEEVSSA